MKRPAKKSVVKPRTPIAEEAAKLPIEPGSLFDMDQTGSLESFAAESIDEAIDEPLRDATGEHRVAQALGSSQRGIDQDEKKRFSDPSRVIEAVNLRDDARGRDDIKAGNLFGTFSDDDDDPDDDSGNGVS